MRSGKASATAWLFNRKSWARWLLAALLGAYGFVTIGMSIADLDDTDDELLFRKGDSYLAGQFDSDRDHPPLSALVGLLFAPKDRSNVEGYRWGHAVLYVGGGAAVVVVLEALELGGGALLFALLAVTTPPLKAMAALNVSDADVAVFLVLAAVALFCRLETESRGIQITAMVLAGFFVGLASTAKPSGLGYVPFLLGVPLAARRRAIVRDVTLGALAFALALWLSYLFHPDALRFYASVLSSQQRHFKEGYPAIVFGCRFDHGVWYFYLVHLGVKLPLPALVVVTLGWAWGLCRRLHGTRAEVACFLLPACALLVILSAGSVQPGVRYALPVLMLAFAGVAIALNRRLAVRHLPRQVATAAFTVLAVLLVAIDAHALWSGSYLAYFNALVKNPTRQFAFSSIDWSQGIPHHLRRRYPQTVSFAELPVHEILTGNGPEPVYVRVGATALSGAVPDRAQVLARLSPQWSVAGYEIHALTQTELFCILGWADIDRDVCTCPEGGPVTSIERRMGATSQVAALRVDQPTLLSIPDRASGGPPPRGGGADLRRWLLPGADAAQAVEGIDASTELLLVTGRCSHRA